MGMIDEDAAQQKGQVKKICAKALLCRRRRCDGDDVLKEN